jgi:hypothetical protein
MFVLLAVCGVLLLSPGIEGYKKQNTFVDKNALYRFLSTKVNQSVDQAWPTSAVEDKESLQLNLMRNLFPLLLSKATDTSRIHEKIPKLDPAWEWKVMRSTYRTLLQSPLVHQKS